MLKYNPPKITIVYHFENQANERYYHDIFVERRMLESSSDEEIASHLYMSEAYYFNPKQIKRNQVIHIQFLISLFRFCASYKNLRKIIKILLKVQNKVKIIILHNQLAQLQQPIPLPKLIMVCFLL